MCPLPGFAFMLCVNFMTVWWQSQRNCLWRWQISLWKTKRSHFKQNCYKNCVSWRSFTKVQAEQRFLIPNIKNVASLLCHKVSPWHRTSDWKRWEKNQDLLWSDVFLSGIKIWKRADIEKEKKNCFFKSDKHAEGPHDNSSCRERSAGRQTITRKRDLLSPIRPVSRITLAHTGTCSTA